MSNKKNKNIDWSVISRNLFGSVSEAEKLEFEEWLECSMKHKKYAEQSKSFYVAAENEEVKRPDTEKAIAEFKKHIAKKKGKKIKLAVVLRYAASILIPICIATYLILNTNKFDENTLASGIETIEPGSSKAELLLANGEVLSLEQGDTIVKESDGTEIQNISGMLKYQSNQNLLETETYNTLKIPRGGEYKLRLADGTQVWLNSATSFKYPTKFVGDKRIVYLSGEAFFKVGHNKEMPFIVKVDDLNVKVLGTAFNVKAYSDEKEIKTTLVNGRVEVLAQGIDNKIKTVLSPNFQACYSKGNKKIEVNAVDASIFTAWKDGVFVLDNMNLEDLSLILSRWYDVDFFFVNEKVKENYFTGRMKKYESLQDIFDLLEQLSDVSFVIKDNAVIVQEKV